MTPAKLSKITPPQLTNTLPRPRLLNLLKKNTDKKLILILGQAAQGKSTLAASFLKQIDAPVAWVNLEPEESDPVNLFQAIIQSLQQALPEGDWASLMDFPSRTMGPRDPIGFYREWIRGLAGNISAPVFLALDGLDRLVSDSLAFPFLQILLDESPPELRLVLSSRRAPPKDFNYQPLEERQKALVLINEDLAFTRAEIRNFFTQIRKISLNSERLEKILQATGGWVGGLILLAETLEKNSAESPDQYLGDGGLNRFRVEAFEYLGLEIFVAQSPEVQNLLVKSALVPFVDPELMRVLAGAADAEEILKDFVRRNLFVQESYEPGRGRIFRFHQLFREFLLNRFMRTVSEKEKAALCQEAAVLLRNRGDLEEAVYMFLQAEDIAAAASIIKQIGMGLVEKGRIEDLSKLLGALSEDLIQQDPWLLLLLSLTRRWNEMHENLDRFSCCLALFEKAGDVKGVLLSLAYLLEASMICRSSWNSLLGLFQKAEGWLFTLDPDSYPEEKAYVWLNMGLSQVLFGNARKGYQACQHAYRIAGTLKNSMLECRALGHSLEGLSILGEFRLAEKVAQQLEKLAGSIKDIESRVWAYAAFGLFNTFTGNRGKAFDDLSEARRLISENGLFYFYILLLTLEVIWQGYFGSLEVAESKAQEVVAIAESLDNDFIKGNPRVLLGFSYYKAGRYDKATELFLEALEYISSDKGYSESRLYGVQVVQGMINHHLFKNPAGIRVLETILDYARAINHNIFLVDIHLGLALIRGDHGDKTGAGEHVKAGLILAREKNYYYSFLLSPKDVVKGCLLAFELGIEEVYIMARELLTNHYAKVAESELLEKNWDYSLELQSEKQGLLRTFHCRKVPFLEIRTLGGLRIIRNGDQITEDSWAGQQPKKFLLALLCHPGGKVSKNILIEELWPEEETDRGENNFKVTLMRLRKSLEPKIHPTFGSSYIHLRNNTVFLNPEFTRTDVNEFLKYVDKGNWNERAQDARGAMEHYEKALEIYQEDFLPEENSLPIVDRRRDDLKRTSIETLRRLAKLSEELGSMKKASGFYRRLLEADPLQEEACRAFMRLCLTLGNYNEALRAFETLKINLRKELRSLPDPQTLALYQRLREKAVP